MSGDPATGGAGGRALLRIERGNPSEEELAALTAVLLAHTGVAHGTVRGGCPADEEPEPLWHRPERLPLFLNPRAWR